VHTAKFILHAECVSIREQEKKRRERQESV